MKKSIIISAFVLPAVFLIFSSNKSGPASSASGIFNGGPGSIGTCGNCHVNGAPVGTTTISIALREKATGTNANGVYKPGVVYTVTLSGTNPNFPFFGFQLSAANAANQQAGSFSNLGGDKHIYTQNSFQIVEHSTSIAKTNGNYVATLDWTAPSAGTGTVRFFSILNGVNNDGLSFGDKPSAPLTVSLTEESGTAINEPDLFSDVMLYPNPANDMLHVRSERLIRGKYNILILDVNGKEVFSGKQNADPSSTVNIPLKTLRSGIYFLRMEGNDQKILRAFTKK